MAATATSPAARLKLLAKAKEKAAQCRRGETLTFMPMAAMIGVSRVTFRGWCEEIPGFAGSGCFEGGAQGIEYSFRPLKTVNFLIRHFEKERDRRAQRQRRANQLVGVGDVPEEFSLDDLNKVIGLSIKVQEQRERQRKLVDADEVRSVLTACFSTMQQAVMRAAMEQDPTGQWPADIRESFENAMRNVLTAQESAARDCLSALRPSG